MSTLKHLEDLLKVPVCKLRPVFHHFVPGFVQTWILHLTLEMLVLCASHIPYHVLYFEQGNGCWFQILVKMVPFNVSLRSSCCWEALCIGVFYQLYSNISNSSIKVQFSSAAYTTN